MSVSPGCLVRMGVNVGASEFFKLCLICFWDDNTGCVIPAQECASGTMGSFAPEAPETPARLGAQSLVGKEDLRDAELALC